MALIFVLLSYNFAIAQTNLASDTGVQGIVKDTKGSALVGVTILEEGTNNGVSTNADGRFEIRMKQGSNLLVSFIGYVTRTIPVAVNSSTFLTITLEEEVQRLNDVVVIGYGSMKKGEVTSAITSVKKDDFIKGMVKSPEQLLQGKVAGLQLSNYTGDPVTGLEMTIRGANSLSGNTSPLIVIDGIAGGSMAAISSEDIESIDVLKDGSAAAIYGTRGTNGVIIITTNRPKSSTISLEYNGSITLESISKHADMLTADDYNTLKDDPAFVGIQNEGQRTDWVDAISRTAISHNHFLSLRGGSERSSYVASVDYRNRQGIINKTDRESITAKIGLNHSMFDNKLRIQLNINDSYVTQQKVWYNAYLHALLQNPTRPIYDENGNYTEYKMNLKPFNPVAMINEENDQEGYNQLMMNAKVTYTPVSGLNLSLMGAMQRFDRMENKNNTFKHMATVVNKDGGNVWNWADNRLQKTLELVADYTKLFGQHNFGAMVGYSFQEDDNKGLSQWAKDFPTDMFGSWNIGSLNEMKDDKASMGSYRNKHRLISFFGRITYNYAEKYMLMASLRYEGSTRFGANHKWGWFPAVSAGWRISKENFMRNARFVDDLKLRIGFGVTGNEVGSDLLSLYLLGYGNYSYLNGKWIQGAGPYQNPNPDLKWETKSELNVGVDFSFFKGRLSGSIDGYRRITSDLLSTYEVPTPPYIVPNMMANVGKIKNAGVEVMLSGSPVRTQNFKFDITATFAYNKNKIVSLSNDKYEKDYWYTGATGSPIQTYTHIVKEGSPIGDFYGFQTHSLNADGQWLVVGADGEPKLLTAADDGDKRVIGNGIPTMFGSINFAFSYKGFDLGIMFRGAFDFEILNRQRMHWETTSRIGEGNLPRSVLEKPFDSGSYVKGAPAMQSYYVENGNYVKLDNVSIGYTFNLKNQSIVKRLRVYAAGNNLCTITNYKGLDPEVSSKGLAPGVEGSGAGELYPTTRLFSIGVNLLF
ncbi:MAG: TonB-dependent receptor [Alistipes sp.]